MRLYEYEAKGLMAERGIPVPRGDVAKSAERAVEVARSIGGPVVVKAQVPAGKRMELGGIRFADSADEAARVTESLVGSCLAGWPVSTVLVEERVPVKREVYLGVTYDTVAKTQVALLTTAGGTGVEDAVGTGAARAITYRLDPSRAPRLYEARQAVGDLGLAGKDLPEVATILHRLIQLFLETDSTLLEVNPLGQTGEGRWYALDARAEIDEDALFRQRGLGSRPERSVGAAAGARPPSSFEVAAALIDSQDHRGVAGRLVEFEGNTGLLIGGGGCSLTVFDAVLAHGGSPANYCEIGGNPSVSKLAQLTELILSKPGVDRIAVIMNVVNNTRADLVARGVIKGVLAAGRKPADTIKVFRVPGAWEEESVQLLRHYEVRYADRTVSIEEAARIAVEC